MTSFQVSYGLTLLLAGIFFALSARYALRAKVINKSIWALAVLTLLPALFFSAYYFHFYDNFVVGVLNNDTTTTTIKPRS